MSNQPAPRRMSDEEMEKADMLIQSGYLGLHGHPYRKSMMRLRSHITALEAERAVVAGEADEVAERLFELINNLHRGSGTMHDQLSNFISPILIERDRRGAELDKHDADLKNLKDTIRRATTIGKSNRVRIDVGKDFIITDHDETSLAHVRKTLYKLFVLRNSPGGEGESK